MEPVRALVFLAACWVSAVRSGRIAWGRDKEEPWYFDAETEPSPQSRPAKKGPQCREPLNLPQQFMTWFRESHSDPSMLAYMADVSEHERREEGTGRMEEMRMPEPPICTLDPSDSAQSHSLMERSLCPWEWRVNRDEEREPKLISEAVCLCRSARGIPGALCVPIRREFPVLRRVYCDHRRFQYVRAFQTITVGCHSVVNRVARAVSPLQHLQNIGVLPGS